MKSSEYWKKRFEQLEHASNTYGQQTYRKIENAFEKAQRQIEGQINAWYGRFADNNEMTIQKARKLLKGSELKELQWDVKEYIKYGHQNELNPMWMKELENASAKYHISRLEALKLRTQHAAEVAFGNELDEVDAMARRVFNENYYHSIFEMQKGFNIGWDIGQIDERKLEKIISRPWAGDGKNFSTRIWEQKSQLINELHTQLTRACILGKAPDNAINAIARKFKTAKSQAGRLVMTEQAYFHSLSQKEAFEDLDVEEFEIVATLDSHTSTVCQDMDGQHFPMKEYEPGMTAPPFHPWCRSVTVPYFEDNFTGERAARDAETGKTYYVPDNMDYKEWHKKFVKGGNKDDLMHVDKVDVITNTTKETSKVNYGWKDVTTKYLSNSNGGSVKDVNNFIQDGVEYSVNGRTVVLEYKKNEKHVADVLSNKLNANVLMMPKVYNPQGVKTPDYLIDGKRFDLKSPIGSGKEVLYNMIRGKQKQADNFVFDISNCPLSEDVLVEQAKKMFISKHVRFLNSVILFKNDNILMILQRNH